MWGGTVQTSQYKPLDPSWPPLGITEDEALRGDGQQVHIFPSKHGLMFNVAKAGDNMYKITRNHWIVALAMISACLLCGIFLIFYAPYRINQFLDYPTTNCTVVDYTTFQTSKGGTMYSVDLSYITSSGEEKEKTITMSVDDFNSKHWTIGSQFLCLYKGGFIEPYDTVHDELTWQKKFWFLALIVPAGGCTVLVLYFFGFFKLISSIQSCRGIRPVYFPRNISYRDDKEFVIADWYDARPDAQPLLYLLFKTHYAKTYPGVRQITCVKSKRSVGCQKGLRLFAGIWTLVIGLGFTFGFGGWLLSGYDAGLYLLGVSMAPMGLMFVALGAYILVLSQKPLHIVDTNEISVLYTVHSAHKLTGSITTKTPAAV